jgi:DNA-directed RNA polymerase subunit alpha
MILLPKPPKIVEEKENWACFEIEALYPGYGVTIGNALRRVLISSLEGAAATQVNIKGVHHEFSTIPGVFEDVINIMMNLKQMRFKLYADEPQKAVLRIKGLPAGKQERIVKGSDFKLPTQVELVNPSCYIATLTDKKAELEMEIKIEKGIGYQPAEEKKKHRKSEIGEIPLDSIFTPVKKVNYRVENMRVGERTDFDKLYLEITTDGTIKPEEAFQSAADILVRHFSLMSGAFQGLRGKNKLMSVSSQKEEKEPAKKVSPAKKKIKETKKTKEAEKTGKGAEKQAKKKTGKKR